MDFLTKAPAGKKGFPQFKKHQTHGAVEYKVGCWESPSSRKQGGEYVNIATPTEDE